MFWNYEKWDLSIEGKIAIPKQKIINLRLVTSVPALIIEQFNITKKLYLAREKPKIKHCTLRNNYELNDLKDTYIFYSTTSLQCAWVGRLFDENFHEWKIIPPYLIWKVLEANFKFHSVLDISKCPLEKVPLFYLEILTRRGEYCSSRICTPSTIIFQLLCFNKNIKIDEKCIILRNFQ